MVEAKAPPSDRLGRPLEDLRISVTDRCNFRCTFCMPAHQSYTFLARKHLLTFEEIAHLAGLFTRLGVRKIRLTGGEPLLRAELPTLVSKLAHTPGVEDLALTSNGALLGRFADGLAEAGLDRVTVSLHALDPDIFGRLSGLDVSVQTVLDGIAAAQRAGLGPVKLNTVVIKGVNDHELEALARFARDQGCVLRLIEFMDVGTLNRWDPSSVITAREIVSRIDRLWPLDPVSSSHRGEVAKRWRYRDGGGEIGVISSVSEPFCGDCTRARLSAEGTLMTCLFAQSGYDLKTPLRDGESDAELIERIRTRWSARTDRYSEARREALDEGTFAPAPKIEMFRIGG